MKTLNKVFLIGAVGKDPEMRATNGGVAIATLPIATTERFKQNGEWTERTEWHNLKAFGRTAEVIRDYVQKGSPLHIEGRLNTESWEDKATGQKRYKTVIIIDSLSMLGGKRDGQQGGGRQQQSQPQDDFTTSGEISDEEIPF